MQNSKSNDQNVNTNTSNHNNPEVIVESPLDQFQRDPKELFYAHLPHSLYMSHYELHEKWQHITVDEWRRFLKDSDKFISKELALITESNARKALDRLATGKDVKSSDVTAITNLLKQSEQLNAQSKDKTVYMTMFMPDPKDRKIEDPSFQAVYEKNRANIRHFYDGEFLARRIKLGEVALNADGTLHVINEFSFSSNLDKVYLSLFNPDNKRVTELSEEQERGWQ